MISNMPIHDGDDVVSFFLVDQGESSSRCYSTAFWSPIPYPVYGQYNDYGAVHEFSGNPSETLLLDYIRNHLVELEADPAKYIDTPITKAAISLENLYEWDHDDHLAIKRYQGIQQVRPIMIHRGIFDKILKEYKIEQFTEKDGVYSYPKYGFEDILVDIPRVVDLGIRYIDEEGCRLDGKVYSMMLDHLGHNHWDELKYDLAWRLLPKSRGRESSQVIKFWELVDDVGRDALVGFAQEWLKFAWLNEFIDASRITWHPMGHAGSQNAEMAVHKIRAEFIGEEIARVAKKYDYDEEDEDEEVA